MRRFVVSMKTTTATLDRWLSDEHQVSSVQLDPHLQPDDLMALIHKHGQSAVLEILLELIVGHSAADGRICTAALRALPDSAAVAHAVTMQPKAPRRVLTALRDSAWPHVAEHAALALITRDLKTAPLRQFAELIEQYPGDAGISLGVRHLIAQHPRTPASLLTTLCDDDADFVAEAARQNLLDRRIMRPGES